ncbi:hypothetical protein Tco_0728209 [Tanacetum coccineum]|uniref:Uncharacterized protein n=1 Tax=Tanacetum coccineum TaxID=301880 RepID=A0ABQ4YKJ5_9ASTR
MVGNEVKADEFGSYSEMIIFQSKNQANIHPRTASPLHYSHEESILNTLGIDGKDSREIFGMSIPDALPTDEIKGAPYYGDYQEHVAKYQQFLDAERDKAEEGGVTESSDATKVIKPKAAKVTKPKATKETPDEPSPAKRSKGGLVGKRRKPKSPLKLVDKPNDKGVPVEEPVHTDEEVDLQLALEPSLKRHPMHTEPIGPANSPSLDDELPLTDSETESDKEVPVINVGDQDEGQAGPNPGEQDEG